MSKEDFKFECDVEHDKMSYGTILEDHNIQQIARYIYDITITEIKFNTATPDSFDDNHLKMLLDGLSDLAPEKKGKLKNFTLTKKKDHKTQEPSLTANALEHFIKILDIFPNLQTLDISDNPKLIEDKAKFVEFLNAAAKHKNLTDIILDTNQNKYEVVTTNKKRTNTLSIQITVANLAALNKEIREPTEELAKQTQDCKVTTIDATTGIKKKGAEQSSLFSFGSNPICDLNLLRLIFEFAYSKSYLVEISTERLEISNRAIQFF